MSLAEKYPQEIEKILAKYPPEHKRSAVMPLIYLAQREGGYVSKEEMSEIAQITGITSTEVASLIGFYTLFHAEPEGKYRLQVCTDLPCALRGSQEFLDKLCDELGIAPGETTPDGLITIEEVKCIAACDHAPVLQVQSPEGIEYHEDMTVEMTLGIIDALRESAKNGEAKE